MFHSNHRILSLVHSHIAVLHIAMFFYPSYSFFLYPFRMPSEADSLKWFTLKIRGKEF